MIISKKIVFSVFCLVSLNIFSSAAPKFSNHCPQSGGASLPPQHRIFVDPNGEIECNAKSFDPRRQGNGLQRLKAIVAAKKARQADQQAPAKSST